MGYYVFLGYLFFMGLISFLFHLPQLSHPSPKTINTFTFLLLSLSVSTCTYFMVGSDTTHPLLALSVALHVSLTFFGATYPEHFQKYVQGLVTFLLASWTNFHTVVAVVFLSRVEFATKYFTLSTLIILCVIWISLLSVQACPQELRAQLVDRITKPIVCFRAAIFYTTDEWRFHIVLALSLLTYYIARSLQNTSPTISHGYGIIPPRFGIMMKWFGVAERGRG